MSMIGIPEECRTKSLSKVDPVHGTYHQVEGCYYQDSDFCFLEDPQSEFIRSYSSAVDWNILAIGKYHDLTAIPER
ncbi:hypothetical protein EV361DRAFT_668732 [Lentinula raphanica]|nr:hypothetical protein EV361DRAFT_668732 [Lentinula raphanica]